MSTPHNRAEKGDFAKTVLMPGDPLRAEFAAERYLENPRCVTDVRGMLGYTGKYKGKEVSIMGSGMGMPSIGIYSHELYSFYGVENIIRIGSAGSYSDKAKILDVVLATAAYSDSSFAKEQSGYEDKLIYPSEELNEKIIKSAQNAGVTLIKGIIHSSDVFYSCNGDAAAENKRRDLRDTHGCICVEMESFALFSVAKALGKNAACLVTISDSFVSHEELTSEQRQKSFNEMIETALGAAIL